MGFFDNVMSTAQRGKETVERKGREAQLKMQLNDVAKQRKELAAQLGASLYETVKNDPAFTTGREDLFKAIEEVDQRKVEIEAAIEEIAAEAKLAQASAGVFECPNCGYNLRPTDLFCTGCGTPVADYIAQQIELQMKAQEETEQAPPVQPSARFCANCGSSVSEGDVFCMKCGARIEPPIAAEAELQPAAEEEMPQDEVQPIEDAPIAEASVEEEPVVTEIDQLEDEPTVEPQVEEIAEAVEETNEQAEIAE